LTQVLAWELVRWGAEITPLNIHALLPPFAPVFLQIQSSSW